MHLEQLKTLSSEGHFKKQPIITVREPRNSPKRPRPVRTRPKKEFCLPAFHLHPTPFQNESEVGDGREQTRTPARGRSSRCSFGTPSGWKAGRITGRSRGRAVTGRGSRLGAWCPHEERHSKCCFSGVSKACGFPSHVAIFSLPIPLCSMH